MSIKTAEQFDKLISDAVLRFVPAEEIIEMGIDNELSKQLSFTQDVLLSKLFFDTVEQLAQPEYHI